MGLSSPSLPAERAAAAPPCPVCGGVLSPAGPWYSLEGLFALWSPAAFSREVIEEHRRQAAGTRLHVCRTCALEIYWPQIVGTPGFYDALQQHEQVAYYTEDRWEFHHALADVRAGDKVAELGCGPGVFLQRLKQRGCDAVGTEYNNGALRAARALGFKVFAGQDDLSPIEGRMDAAFAFHVLEHVPDPVSFVEKAVSLLRPGGRLGISVPDMDGPVRHVDPCISNMPPHHATRWRLPAFTALAARL